MVRRRTAILAVLACCGVLQAAQAPAKLTIDEYCAALDTLISSAARLNERPAETADVVRQIPSAWSVQNGPQSFEVPGDALQDRLRESHSKTDPALLKAVQKHLASLRAEAEGYRRPAPGISQSRSRLNAILSRSEFQNVHSQTWRDRLRNWFQNALLRLIGAIFGSSSFPAIGRILVYGLVAMAVFFLAWWAYRAIRREARAEDSLSVPVPVSAKAWTLWLAEARAAAERGEWGDAVHLGYWAGISFLESQEMWPPDQARTPREYLRLLPISSGHAPALTDLTRRFEVVWYGRQPAGVESFNETLSCLEKLGCRST